MTCTVFTFKPVYTVTLPFLKAECRSVCEAAVIFAGGTVKLVFFPMVCAFFNLIVLREAATVAVNSLASRKFPPPIAVRPRGFYLTV